jgi:hypothetical protein
MACGHFSDISFVAGGKRRDFCRLRSRGCLPTPAQTVVVAFAHRGTKLMSSMEGQANNGRRGISPAAQAAKTTLFAAGNEGDV